MASSLLFRIQSIFDNTGFREAAGSFASTLGWVGKLAAGMGKLAFSAKGIGAIGAGLLAWDVAKAGVGILKFLYNAAPAAAKSEVAFNRLSTQLRLMGKGSAANINMVKAFADQVSQKTQFAGTEVQAAVTAALRRTGDMRLALKQVSVAQDFAAATGMDLATATNILNRAQAGYTRVLTQVTDLRQSDIQQAVRQGTLLDLIAKKFSGAASSAASTYAGKLAILANAHAKLGEEIGSISLPIRKLITDLEIFGTTVLINTTKGVKQLQGGLLGLPLAFILAKKEADAFKRAMAPGKEFTFNFDKELELENARLGKTRDERQQIARDWARIDDILVAAEGDGVDSLSKEQIALVQSTQWGNRQLEQMLSDRVTKTKDYAKKQFEAQRERELGTGDKKGIMDQAKSMLDLVTGATQAKIPLEQLSAELSKGFGISKGIANTISTIGMTLAPAFDLIDKSVESIKAKLATMSGSAPDMTTRMAAIAGQIENIVRTEVQPKFNVKIDFAVPPEVIQEAVRSAIIGSLPGMISSLFRNSTVTASKENKAAAPLA